jgi:hypothetical protein
VFKIKFYFGAFTIVRVPNTNLTLGAFAHLWAPNSNFTPGAFAHFGGPLGPFGVQVFKIKFYFGGFYPSLGSRTLIWPWGFLPIFGPQAQILLWGLLPILGAHWGLLGFRGSK